MSATEELCELLDERGVEHVDEKDGKYLLVTWSHNETSATFVEDTVSGETSIAISAIVTTEQAIAATLGNERERELESLAADMFCWLVDYLTPQQVRTWENRLEDLDVPPTWGVRS